MKVSSYVTQKHMIASFLMNDISRMCRQIVDLHLRSVELTRAQWYLLNYVYLYDGLSQQELADLVDLGKSNIAKQIYSLERNGWVQRKTHEADGRSFRVFLSADMKPIIKKLNKVVQLSLKNLLSMLDKNQTSKLINALRSIDLQLTSELAQTKPTPTAERLMAEVRQELERKRRA